MIRIIILLKDMRPSWGHYFRKGSLIRVRDDGNSTKMLFTYKKDVMLFYPWGEWFVFAEEFFLDPLNRTTEEEALWSMLHPDISISEKIIDKV